MNILKWGASFLIIIVMAMGNALPAFALGEVTPPATPPVVTPPADTTPPAITAVANASLGITDATVVWTTDKLAVSTFEYGTSQSYGSNTSLTSTAVIGGTATLTGLTANTTYYYCIHATSVAGYTSNSCGHSFTTAPAPVLVDTLPPVVSTIVVAPVATSSATVTWATDKLASGQVEYGTTASYGNTSSLDSNLALTHSISLSNLSPNTTYHYRVLSANANGNLTTGTDATFTTGALPPIVVQAPADTVPPVISGVANLSLGSTETTIGWTTNELATSTLRYGTTMSYGSNATIGLTALLAHTATLTNLTPETTYHYCITSTDLYGNTADSCGHSFTTAAAPIVQEMNPPVVTLVTLASVATTSSTITWLSDEVADGQVEYGTTAGYGSSTVLDTNLSLTHSATLSNLSPNTTYHYRVISKDLEGNGTVGPDNTFITNAVIAEVVVTPPMSTSTPPVSTSTPPVIVNPGILTVESLVTGTSTAQIDWTTDFTTTGYIEYGMSTHYGATSSANINTNAHNNFLTGLTGGTTYHFRIHAETSNGGTITSNDYTFTTEALPIIANPIVDVTPPAILTTIVAPVATTSSTVSWTTNEVTTGQIHYGVSTNYTSASAFDSTLSLSHTVTLTSLEPSTLYHYEITATDAANHTTLSSDDTFVTEALPTAPVVEVAPPPTPTSTPVSVPVNPAVISSIEATSIGTSTVTVSWHTDLPSDSQVQYGVTSNLGSATGVDSSLVTSHSVIITGLTPNTDYLFKVRSQPVGGAVATISSEQEFSTLAESMPVSTPANITNVSAAPSTTSASVTWNTDKNANSLVEYGITTSYGESTGLDTSLVMSHDVSIANLVPNTTYHYRVTSVGADGNITISEDHSFTTPALPGNTRVSVPDQTTSLSVASHDSTSATLTWNAPSALADASEEYTIRYSTSPITQNNFGQALLTQMTPVVYPDLQPNGVARTYIVVGLTPGTTYYFALTSKYENSEPSLVSNSATATLDTTPIVVEPTVPIVDTNGTTTTITTNNTSATATSGAVGSNGLRGGTAGGTTIASPTQVSAFGNNSQTTLTWKNPTSHAFVRTIVVEKAGSYPISPADGEVIYNGRGETFTDTGVTNGMTDYYAIYSYDLQSDYSSPVNISLSSNGSTQTTINGQQAVDHTTQFAFTDALEYGDTNLEVMHLQQVLAAHPDIYPKQLVTGYFGGYTKSAVVLFQSQNGLPQTGVADVMTAKALNTLAVSTPTVNLGTLNPNFTTDIQYGDTGDDVEVLQQFLISDGDYPEGVLSTYFGPLTRQAVTTFQTKYGITPAQGYVGIKTRTEIQKLLGL